MYEEAIRLGSGCGQEGPGIIMRLSPEMVIVHIKARFFRNSRIYEYQKKILGDLGALEGANFIPVCRVDQNSNFDQGD